MVHIIYCYTKYTFYRAGLFYRGGLFWNNSNLDNDFWTKLIWPCVSEILAILRKSYLHLYEIMRTFKLITSVFFFYRSLAQNGVWTVNDLLDEQGDIVSYQNFERRYTFKPTFYGIKVALKNGYNLLKSTLRGRKRYKLCYL